MAETIYSYKVKKAPVPSFRDQVSEWKVLCGIGRMGYIVEPGLYAKGLPDKTSPVIVTANYKLTFDRVLRDTKTLDLWILVLDTRGVNVWCAAGKGTFGTDELIKRIMECSLTDIIDHKKLILPQLGAPGISAHEVTAETGFRIIYGPVYSRDIPDFIKAGFKKNEKMKKVNFRIAERIVLIPVEIANAVKPLAAALAAALIYSYFYDNGFYPAKVLTAWFPFSGSAAAGIIMVPVFLPYIPFKAFSLKGAVCGLVFASLFTMLTYTPDIPAAEIVSNFLIAVPAASYFALDFTGATTFTSLSGVKREMKAAVPLYAVSFASGIIIKLLLLF